MATLYQKRGIWYLTTSFDSKRISKSLRTRNKKTAKKLLPIVESELLLRLSGISTKKQNLSFVQLVNLYLSLGHNWAKSTFDLKKHILTKHAKRHPLPENLNTRAIHISHINSCWNWGLKNGYVQTANKLPGDTKGIPRTRVLSRIELELLFRNVKSLKFCDFIKFAYYTGARSGEIRSLSSEQINDGYILVIGKTGKRTVKLNQQAQNVIDSQESLWKYTKEYVSHTFKKECRHLRIKNAQFHDLRRTFGYNLIKQGKPIFEVSKLLGHSSVTTTERHYAPLLTTEIEDFIL